jgi:hypothetical protein
MTKAVFGIAVALALVSSSAWAEEEKSQEQTKSDAVSVRNGEPRHKLVQARATPRIDAGRDGTMAASQPSSEAKLSDEERWLRDREGYRDGGY